MNAVEIEEAVSALAEQPFDPESFPFAFLEAFGNRETTIRRLQSGTTNQSDLPGGVLQRNNIHIRVCPEGEVTAALKTLRESPATTKQKAKLILATDGKGFEAENLADGDTIACAYSEFADHFGFFLPLAGITTVKQIRENAFDIKATSRLNRLYVELLRENPDWGTAARREDLNHFMARLIFCFFAEHTDIFPGKGLFTTTIDQMSARDSSNTHEVLSELFRAMNTKPADRAASNIRSWAVSFPHFNGGLFSASVVVPRFSKIARSYLLHVGDLDWTKINPDIFGSMIQAVTDDEERGALGMHYTSVPNILKVLNPLFLDDLRTRMEEAGNNVRKLLNLRQRIASIRVFDPACGSGNFLVIAYKQMREIEAEINRRRGQNGCRSGIPLTNFRGIELRHFSAEIARLALIIAEYQSDVLYRGQMVALAEFLPLEANNWITCGNALRLDWLSICPSRGETYICGNPPYLGSQDQSPQQKRDLEAAWAGAIRSTKSADYVSGWFYKARQYISQEGGAFAFVTTNSINQGRQVAFLWPTILGTDMEIRFAEPSFLWSNLASKNAAVIVSIIGIGTRSTNPKLLFNNGHVLRTNFIGAYLVPGHDVIVASSREVMSQLTPMTNGSMPNDGGALLLNVNEYRELVRQDPSAKAFIKRFVGSHDSIQGEMRYCIWIRDNEVDSARTHPEIDRRIKEVFKHRSDSDRPETNELASIAHAFGERRHREGVALLVPRHSSESRPYLPSIVVNGDTVVGDSAIAIYSFSLVDFAVYTSRMHLIWVATVCGKIKSDYRYSNSLGWNTFPLPALSQQNKTDLNRCAEDILLAREAFFPATIAELYDPETMPANLREAHERNDETLERIYIGRRFKNDTERLEKLFALYTQMTALRSATCSRAAHPPATAGGTDCLQPGF